jgi:hypothetical protein
LTLKKKRGSGGTNPHQGSGSRGSNAGPGSAAHHCDTCLENPDE